MISPRQRRILVRTISRVDVWARLVGALNASCRERSDRGRSAKGSTSAIETSSAKPRFCGITALIISSTYSESNERATFSPGTAWLFGVSHLAPAAIGPGGSRPTTGPVSATSGDAPWRGTRRRCGGCDISLRWIDPEGDDGSWTSYPREAGKWDACCRSGRAFLAARRANQSRSRARRRFIEPNPPSRRSERVW